MCSATSDEPSGTPKRAHLDSPSMRSHWVTRLLSSAPVLVPVFFAVLAAVGTTMVLLDSFDGVLATAIAFAVTVVLARVIGLGEEVITRKALLVDLLAIGLALAFGFINAKYSAQNVVVGRDPGTYAVTAQWLLHHSTLDIDTQQNLFGNVFGYAGAGFGQASPVGHIYSQGAHGLPEVLAAGGSLFGSSFMFRMNALIGGLALLAVYGFARLVIGRWPALIAAGLVGLSLPQIAFARDAYTEPISQLLVFGGLALLWQCRPGQSGRWAIAGAVLAASCLTRIDAFLVLPPLVAFAALRLAITLPAERKVALRDTAALLAGAAVPALLGLRDLQQLSSGYYRDLHGQFSQIFALIALSVVVGVVAVVVGWKTPLLAWFEEHGTSWRNRAGDLGAGLVVLVGLILALRPLYMEGDGAKPGQFGLVGALQKGAGQRFAPERTYAENSVTWLAWYAGPLATALALLGVALLVRRVVRDRRLELLPFLAFLLVTALLYLLQPSITPDQIWAMRRYVPIVIPGLAICALLVLTEGLRRLSGNTRTVVAVVAGIALFAPVAYITRPLLTVREGTPQLQEIQRVCDTLPDRDGVVIAGDMGFRYAMTVRSFCLSPAATVGQDRMSVNALSIAAKKLASDGRQLWILGADDVQPQLAALSAAGEPVIFNQLNTKVWAKALETPPRGIINVGRNFYLGHVGLDGKVDRWAPSYDGIPKSAAKKP